MTALAEIATRVVPNRSNWKLMTLAIRAAQGDWGGAQLGDIEEVARSASAHFGALTDDESIAIVLEATIYHEETPMTRPAVNSSGEFQVRLNVRGHLWAKLAFQFAHEYCHVLADPRTYTVDRFTWIEEALCETASLFALRDMAKTWAVEPPYPNWRDYSSSLTDYFVQRVSDPARCLPAGARFSSWLSARLRDLEEDPLRRDDNTIVAKELLPIFEADPGAWRSVRFLHGWPRPSSSASLAEFMKRWIDACPSPFRTTVESISVQFRVEEDNSD